MKASKNNNKLLRKNNSLRLKKNENKILLTKLSSKDIDNMRCSAYQCVL